MAYSKTFLLLGLVFAVVLLVSSEVSARELAQETVQTDAVNKDKHGHHHGHDHRHGHGHGHGHGHHGKPGHGAAGEKLEETDQN
ncbi:glycine-rich protein DC7.1-like [Quercus lobata]|uniref:Phase-change related protein n=1 Tax=Quercus lobata TaxID=97700 RepID=A0A7N2M836_QUELO|nr:glycine-rich protein DC7.1-like [Quercus lobata]